MYAIKDRRAETAAKYVADFCLDFGIPIKLLSDKDPAYEAALFQELMNILQIKKLRTSGYRPQTNGLTEKFNSEIKKYLTIFLAENNEKNNWDLLLKLLSYAYNSSVHTSTKHTPAQLMFGRNFKLPTDILYGNFDKEGTGSIKEFGNNLRRMYRCANEAMKTRQLKTKEIYDRKRTIDPLQKGDFVYVLNPRNKNVKLEVNYDGPFEIIDKSEHVYAIQMPRRNKLVTEWLPRDRLRKSHCQNVSSSDDTNKKLTEIQTTNALFYSTDSSSSSDESIEDIGVPQGYNFRPRPRNPIDRLQVSFLNLL